MHIHIINGPEPLHSYNFLLSETGEGGNKGKIIPLSKMSFESFKKIILGAFENTEGFKVSIEVEKQNSIIVQVPLAITELERILIEYLEHNLQSFMGCF